MFFFLTLRIGAIFYAVYISFWDWGLRGPREFAGTATTSGSSPTRSSTRRSSTRSTTRSCGCRSRWPLACSWRSSSTRRSAARRSSARRSTSRRSRARPPSPSCGCSSSARRAVQRRARGARAQPLLRVVRHRPNHNWIATSNTALNTIIALNVWTTSGTFMLFYLASLQTISNELYEAAAIDGAGPWKRSAGSPSRSSGRPTTSWLTVAVIGGLQMFDQAYIGGGRDGTPNNSLTTIVLFIYRAAVADFDFGFAAAVGVVLFVIIMSLTLVQRRLFGGRRPGTDDGRPPGTRRARHRGHAPSPGAVRPVGRPGAPAPPARVRPPHRLRPADVRPVRLDARSRRSRRIPDSVQLSSSRSRSRSRAGRRP